jgi:hypothetical protein
MDHIIREKIQSKLCITVNTEDGLTFSRSLKPHVHTSNTENHPAIICTSSMISILRANRSRLSFLPLLHVTPFPWDILPMASPTPQDHSYSFTTPVTNFLLPYTTRTLFPCSLLLSDNPEGGGSKFLQNIISN